MSLFALAPILSTGLEILNRIIPDPDLREKLTNEFKSSVEAGKLQEAIAKLRLIERQIDVNLAEANSQFLFVAGWRPFIGWSCGIIFLLSYGISYIIEVIAFFAGVDLGNYPQPSDLTVQVLLGMLGINASLRTYEKYKGVAQNHTGKESQVDELKWYKAKIKRLERQIAEYEKTKSE